MFTDVFHRSMLTERHRKLINHATYKFPLMEPGEVITYNEAYDMPDINQLKKVVSISAKRIRLKYDKKFQLSCKRLDGKIVVTRIE